MPTSPYNIKPQLYMDKTHKYITLTQFHVGVFLQITLFGTNHRKLITLYTNMDA